MAVFLYTLLLLQGAFFGVAAFNCDSSMFTTITTSYRSYSVYKASLKFWYVRHCCDVIGQSELFISTNGEFRALVESLGRILKPSSKFWLRAWQREVDRSLAWEHEKIDTSLFEYDHDLGQDRPCWQMTGNFALHTTRNIGMLTTWSVQCSGSYIIICTGEEAANPNKLRTSSAAESETAFRLTAHSTLSAENHLPLSSESGVASTRALLNSEVAITPSTSSLMELPTTSSRMELPPTSSLVELPPTSSLVELPPTSSLMGLLSVSPPRLSTAILETVYSTFSASHQVQVEIEAPSTLTGLDALSTAALTNYRVVTDSNTIMVTKSFIRTTAVQPFPSSSKTSSEISFVSMTITSTSQPELTMNTTNSKPSHLDLSPIICSRNSPFNKSSKCNLDLCSCRCGEKAYEVKSTNFDDAKNKIRRELVVNVSHLSSTTRRLTSARDLRLSSTMIGVPAMMGVGALLAFLVCSDMANVYMGCH